MQKEYTNVVEAYPLYDTILVCQTFYGKEQTVNGWFTSFLAFAAQETHTFFKNRTEGNSHLAYCNLQSADQIDYVFKAYSFGVRFFAPVCPDAVADVSPVGLYAMQEGLNAFWLFDLPYHCGVSLSIQQDVVIEAACMISSPGYGPRGSGGCQPLQHAGAVPPAPWQLPWQTVAGSQSEPVIDCRFKLPSPLEIARNTPIEATLYVSRYARHIIGQLYNGSFPFTQEYQTGDPDVGIWKWIPSRWGIQVSLYGVREVQQRGQYFAPGYIPKEEE